MIRRGLVLIVALVLSGLPAALQICGSHCVTPVSCHEAAATDARSAVKAGPQICPHAVALGAVMAIKSLAPRPTISIDAVGHSVIHLDAPLDVSIVRSIDRLSSLSAHHALVQQLRI